MQVLNISSNLQNAGPALILAKKNNFSPKLQNRTDSVSFGRRREEDEDEESSSRPRRKGFGGKIFKVIMGLLAALGLASGGVQGYNSANAALAQRNAMEAFRDNPKRVAIRFINKYAMGGDAFGDDYGHLEYSIDQTKNPFEIKNWSDSILGPDSVVGYEFLEGAFSSASLDIDGDKHPEIIVTLGEDGNYTISYDYDSDGEIDTIETLGEENE